jgi:hypothetical protein
MKLGDLVWIVFPYVENELAIYIREHQDYDHRAEVLWNGEIAAILKHQVEKHDETG